MSTASPSSSSPTGGDLLGGVRTGAPAALAIFPVGIALGVLVLDAGLPWWTAPLLSALVLAGSLEFVLVGMISGGAALGQVAVTSLLVNFRHIFYALTYPIERVRTWPGRAYGTFSLTDEAYAMMAVPAARTWSERHILIAQATFHAGWFGGSVAGALGGALIPPQVQGIEFASVALFAVLTAEAWKARRSVPVGLLALVCALGGAALFGDAMLAPSMAVFVGVLVAEWFRRDRRLGPGPRRPRPAAGPEPGQGAIDA